MESLDLIERYFENSLTESELRDFQQKLETDEAFAQAFQLEQDLMEGIEVMGNQNLKEELKGIYKEEVLEREQVVRPKAISRRLWLGAAAAIALLIVAAWFFNRPTPERLYARYFQPEFDFVEKGSTEELVSKAEGALKKKAYSIAIPYLEELIKLYPENMQYLMAKGIAMVETSQLDDGISIFTQIGNTNGSFKSEASWYHGLALLKQGRLQESYAVLQQIQKTSSRYNEATELAKQIETLY